MLNSKRHTLSHFMLQNTQESAAFEKHVSGMALRIAISRFVFLIVLGCLLGCLCSALYTGEQDSVDFSDSAVVGIHYYSPLFQPKSGTSKHQLAGETNEK